MTGTLRDVAADTAKTDSERIRVIWNARAGSKGGIPTNRGSEEEVRDLLARHGLGDDLVATQTEDEAIAATRAAVADGYGIVVAAGGDGTVSLVAFELLESSTALGILPFGSAMNVGRSLGIPRDSEQAADIIRAGHRRTIDIGEGNGVPFLEVGSVGLNATIFGEGHRLDKGEYASFFHLIAEIARYRPARIRITLDGRVVRSRALMVAVANTPYTGLGFTFAPDALLDDGQFDVRVYSGFSKTELLRHLGSIALGRRSYSAKVETYRAAEVHIAAAHRRPCRIDDRDLGTTPVTFRIRPGVLTVVAPPPGSVEGAA